MKMTLSEFQTIAAFDLVESQGRDRQKRQAAVSLLRDALDALEIGEPGGAKRRIQNVIKDLERE